MSDTLSIFWSPRQNQNKKCSSNTRTCPTHITRRSFCMMPQFAKQGMDKAHPLWPAGQVRTWTTESRLDEGSLSLSVPRRATLRKFVRSRVQLYRRGSEREQDGDEQNLFHLMTQESVPTNLRSHNPVLNVCSPMWCPTTL